MSGAGNKARGTSYPYVRRQQRTLNKPQHHKSHTTTLQQQRIVAKPSYNVTATTHRCQIPPHCYSNSKSLRYFYHKTLQTKSHHGLASVRSRQLSSHMLERHSINTREERPSCRIMALPSVLRPTPQGNNSCLKATHYAPGHQFTRKTPLTQRLQASKTPQTHKDITRTSSTFYSKQTNNQTNKQTNTIIEDRSKQHMHNHSSSTLSSLSYSSSLLSGIKTPAASKPNGATLRKPNTQGKAKRTQ